MVTLDTAYKCFAKLDIEPINGEFAISCGSDVSAGCTISYTFSISDRCYYKIYDGSGQCVDEKVFEAETASGAPNSVRGGGFDVLAEYSRIVFSDKVSLSRSETHTVRTIISDVDDVVALLTKLVAYDIPSEDVQDIINLYLDSSTGSGTSLEPTGVQAGTYGSYVSGSYYYVPNITVDEYGRITAASQSFLGYASSKSGGLISQSDYTKLAYIHSNQSTVLRIYAGNTTTTGTIYIYTTYTSDYPSVAAHGIYTGADGYEHIMPVKHDLKRYSATSTTWYLSCSIDAPLDCDLTILVFSNFRLSSGK